MEDGKMNLNFKKGILGFEHCKNFEVKDIEENPLFKILESKEEEEFNLVIVSPFDVEENYEFQVPDATLKNLEIDSEKDVMVYSTVTVNSDMKKTTTNLRAPIVINTKNNLAEQIILSDEKYKIKHPLLKG